MDARDRVISPWVVATGGFQREDLAYAVSLLRDRGCDPTIGWFVDVGANIGTSTLYALHDHGFARAVLFEPADSNLRLIRRNLSQNGFDDRAIVCEAAVDRLAGSVQLAMNDDEPGDHRVVRVPGDHRSVGEVRSVTLDGELAQRGIRASDVGLLWIDTQGHEPGVLAGAEQLLGSGVPAVMEFWPSEYRRSGELDEILQRLQRHFVSFLDLNDASRGWRAVGELDELVGRLPHPGDQTDLVLVPRGH